MRLKFLFNNLLTVNRQPSTFILNFFKQFNYLNFYITEISETLKSLLLKFTFIYILKKLQEFLMKKILVVCRTGMGTSMLLKIKVEQIISSLNLDAEVYHDVTSAISGYNDIDILITMKDLADEFKGKFPVVIGVESIKKEEIKSKILEALK